HSSPAHAGADRNNPTSATSPHNFVARTRGRGSKHLHRAFLALGLGVARTRGRGSKLTYPYEAKSHDCRPHTRARIETPFGRGAVPLRQNRRPHTRARIETSRL